MRGTIRKIFALLFAAIFVTASAQAIFAAEIKPGATGDKAVFVQYVLKYSGYFSYEEITGYYGVVTETAVMNFQKAKDLPMTGIVDDKTLDELEKEILLLPKDKQAEAMRLYNIIRPSGVPDPDPAKVGSMDWFKSAQKIFSVGKRALVIDVATGKTFTIQRTFGHLHADVEPLTKEDTAVMMSIWGKYSWDRRAVVVIIDDYILAASMHFYPHAGVDSAPALATVSNRSGGYGKGQNLDAIKGNNVNGHVCMHFLNSTNHGRSTPDKDHQNAVKKAAKYIDNNYASLYVKYIYSPAEALGDPQ